MFRILSASSLIFLAACSTGQVGIGDDAASSSSSVMMEQEESSSSSSVASAPSESTNSPAAQARVITITTDNWTFSPNVIRVKKGENITIQLVGASGVHGFAVPDLGINQSVSAGNTVSFSLPTAQAGTFAFRCSIPCGAGHKEMTGQIIIEE